MKECARKRGLSPVVASVLLIALVFVLAAIIFLWARGFIGEQIEKFGQPVEKICGQVKFDVAKFANELEILNSGDVDIWYVDIEMIKGGNSEIKSFGSQIDKGEAFVGEFDFVMSDDRQVPEEIVVYPALVGSGRNSNSVFTCMDSGVSFKLDDI